VPVSGSKIAEDEDDRIEMNQTGSGEIDSCVDSVCSGGCPISPDFATDDLIKIKLDQEWRCRSSRSEAPKRRSRAGHRE
jgi:hypothetical protein